MRNLKLLKAIASVYALAVGGAGVVSSPAMANQTEPAFHMQAALDDARQAREDAKEALRKADAAIATLQKIINSQQSGSTTAATSSADASAGSKKLIDECDDRSTVDKMLRIKDEKTGMTNDADEGLNWFTQQCLGLEEYQDFKNTSDVAIQFTGTKDTSVIEVGPTFTIRKLGKSKSRTDEDGSKIETRRSSYIKTSFGAFAALGSDGNAAAFDLDKFEFNSGVGIKAGIEFGLGPRKNITAIKASTNRILVQARRDCIAFHSMSDPIDAAADIKNPVLVKRSFADIAKDCEGAKFTEWLQADSRAYKYWKQIVRPLWGYDDQPKWFVGAEARYAWSDYSYYPIFDTNTGNLQLSQLPPNFLGGKGAAKDKEEPFAVSVYAGASHLFKKDNLKNANIGASLGLTYRREYTFPDKFTDQQVCLAPDGAEFDQCRKINTAAPYKAEGFVGSVAFKLKLPKYSFLPPIAMTIKPSYEFDVNRWGVEVPLYLFADSEGDFSSGLKFTCQSDGQTNTGFKLEEKCGAALFLGTKFKVGGAP